MTSLRAKHAATHPHTRKYASTFPFEQVLGLVSSKRRIHCPCASNRKARACVHAMCQDNIVYQAAVHNACASERSAVNSKHWGREQET